MADNLVKLLFDIAADTTSGQKGVQDLRNVFGIEMDQIGKIVNTTFSQIESKAAYSYGYLGLGARGAARGILDAFQEIAKGASPATSGVDEIGKALDKLSGKSGLTTDQMRIVGRAFGALEDDSTKARLALQLFGDQGLKIIPQLEALGEKLLATDAAAGAAAEGAAGFTASLGALAGVAGVAVVAIGALVIAIVEIEKELFDATAAAAKYGDEIYRASLRTKLSTETLSGLKLATAENSASFDLLVRGLDRYLKNVEDAASGNKMLAREFADLGIDVQKSAQNPVEAIKQLTEAVAGLGGKAAENATLIHLMGRSGDELIPLFRQLAGNIDETTGKAKELGVMLSEDDARALHLFNVAVADLHAQMTGISLAIAKEMGPAFIDLMHQTGQLIATLAPFIEVTLPAFRLLIEETTEVLAAADVVIKALSGDWLAAAAAAQKYYEVTEPYSAKGEAAIPAVKTPAEKPAPLVTGLGEPGLKSQIEASREWYDEAKRKEQDTTADLKLQLDQRTISYKDYVDRRKAALDKMHDDQVAAANKEAELVVQEKRKESESVEDYNDRINTAREKANKRASDADDAYRKAKAQLDADFVKEEEERERAHRERLLNNATVSDQKDIARIQEKNRTTTGYNQEAQQQIAAIDARALDRKQTYWENELKLAGQNVALQQRANDELKKIGEERLANEEKVREQSRAAKERDIADKATQDRAEVNERRVNVEAQIKNEQYLAQQGVQTFEEAARKIQAAQRGLLEFEIRTLGEEANALFAAGNEKAAQAIRNQVNVLKAQLDALRAEGARILGTPAVPGTAPAVEGTAPEEDIRRRQQLEASAEGYYARMQAIIAHGEDAITKEIAARGNTRREVIERENTAKQNALDLAYKLEKDDLNRTLELLTVDENARKKNAAVIKAIEDLLLELEREHNRATKQLADDTTKALNRLSPVSTSRLFGPQFDANLKKINEDLAATGKSVDTFAAKFQAMGQTISDALESVTEQLPTVTDLMMGFLNDTINGLAAVVKNWVLYGETGTAAIRKVLAEALASLAEQATVNALWYTAQGIVDIFFAPERAAADFEAAAIFASIAGVAAIAGRAAAGNLFKQGNTAGNQSGPQAGTGTGTGTGPTPVVMGSQRGQTLHIVFENHPGSMFDTHVVKAVTRDAQNGGPTRNVIVNEINRQG